MVVAETIRHARAEAGLTQSELARRAGIRQASISKFESGRERPRPETYARILLAARVSPEIALQRSRDDVLDAVCRRRASDPRVFVSVAIDRDDSDGDVGVLVTFDPDASLLDAAGLMLDLEKILGTRVAVVSDRAQGRIVDRAVAEAIPL
ncbi:MAG: helix-turn-helix domain-containing protein [Terrimesophilobacter sp.]